MFFIIDGYNLMHAAGFMGARVPANQLAGARKRLLDWLSSTTHNKNVNIRVIFDAQQAPQASPLEHYRGIEVQYAFQETADDAVETELANRAKGSVIVVSDDTRLHESARRRGCEAWANTKFQDWLITKEKVQPEKQVAPEKPVLQPGTDEDLLNVFSQPKPRKKR